METITHKCREDIICLLPNERKYKCYKCLDRNKDYIHKDELPDILHLICEDVIKESHGDKHNRFVQYSKQHTFSEQEVNEILESQNTPDEERQNPLIVELRAVVAKLNTEIEQYKKQVATQQIEIESLRKQIQQNEKKEIKPSQRLNIDVNNLAVGFARNNYSIDMLDQYADLPVEVWMIEWAYRINDIPRYERLLERYFEGIQVEVSKIKDCDHSCCQLITIPCYSQIQLYKQDYLHIRYTDIERYKKNKLPLEPQLDGKTQYEQKLICYFIKYYFNISFSIIQNSNGTDCFFRMGYDLKQEGYMISWNQSQNKGSTFLICENSKLRLSLP